MLSGYRVWWQNKSENNGITVRSALADIYIYMGSVPNLCELPHVYYIYLGILTKMGPYKFLMDDNYINSCTSAMHELE